MNTEQIDKLTLGSELSTTTCEQLLECTRHAPEYQLKLLRLKHEVEQAMKLRYGRTITVRVQQQALQVLTDREAAAYNPKRFADGLRIARAAHRRLLAVDRTKLTPTERQEVEASVVRQAQMLSLMRQRKAPAEPMQQPKLPSLRSTK
jgi:hypothetical protein